MKIKPELITDNDVAWGTTAFLPLMHEIPDDFEGKQKYTRLFNDWFFRGLSSLKIAPKEGVNKEQAYKCICAHMKSFSPKHEHKEAGVAYMISQLLDDAEWEVKK